MKKLLFAIFLISILLFAFGCTKNSEREKAKQACVNLCLAERAQGRNLSYGPCLSNDIRPGWVCDVAHYPREPIDNEPQYQCSAYGKTAAHFVEVTPDCKFIRAK